MKMGRILHILSQLCLLTISIQNVISATITDEISSQESSSNTVAIESIGVQVGENGCNCWMKMRIVDGPNNEYNSCYTNYLDTSGNDFVGGSYQIFSSQESLGECYKKKFYDISRVRIIVFHEGLDGVDIEYWNIMYDDGTLNECKDDYFYDGNDSHSVNCGRKGCQAGYIPEGGDIPGPGLTGGYPASEKQCSDDCSLRNDCKSYSHSNSENTCKLMSQYLPTAENYKDYQFCRRNETVCDIVDTSYIEGYWNSGRDLLDIKTAEECSLKVKDLYPEATGMIWSNEYNMDCRAKYGNSIKVNKNDLWSSCLFTPQDFWPLESADKACTAGDYFVIANIYSQLQCQDICTSSDYCIGISYAENNYHGKWDWAWNCYICYDDNLNDVTSDPTHIGFKRRPV